MTSPEDRPQPDPTPFTPPGAPSPGTSPQQDPRTAGTPGASVGWGRPTEPLGYASEPPVQPRFGQYGPTAPDAAAPGDPAAPGGFPPPQQYLGQQYGGQQYGQQFGGSPYGPPQGFGGGYRPLAARPGIIPLRPLGLGEIYDGAFGAIRRNPKVMLGVVALVIAVATIVATLLGYLTAPSVNRWFADIVDEIDPSGAAGLDGLGSELSTSLFVSIAVSIASLVATGLLIVAISRSVINKPFSTADLWAQVRTKIVGLVVIALLPAVGVLALGAVLLALVFALAQADPAVAGLVSILVVIAIVVVAVWLSVRFLLTAPAYVLEGQGLGRAVRRGWTLSRGSFWRLLGIYVLSNIITNTVAQLILVPATLVSELLFPGGYLTSLGGLVITTLAQVVAFTITTAFLSSVIALLYIDVRIRREGLDVELAAAADGV